MLDLGAAICESCSVFSFAAIAELATATGILARYGSFDKQYLAHIEYTERPWVAIATSAEVTVDSA